MDFDSPPWDSTCEAASTATKDSGMDFAQWQLKAGDIYHLVLYPREDGTAVDAFQLVPPGGTPPAGDTRLKPGDTTLDCPGGPRFTSPVDRPGADIKHHEHDMAGWGHRGNGDTAVGCGACLEPLTDLSRCPTPEQLFALPSCDNVTEGEMRGRRTRQPCAATNALFCRWPRARCVRRTASAAPASASTIATTESPEAEEAATEAEAGLR